ncbi:reverse transcriptase domain-containing protein [Tanacetum coccineum]
MLSLLVIGTLLTNEATADRVHCPLVLFRVSPYSFNYPTTRLTVEEILAKFIDEGKRKHEEMEIFIKEFRTINELLLKERSNLLSELKIKVNELSKVMEINETRINKNEPPRFEQDVQENPHDDSVENKSLSIPERTTQPLVKPQQSSIPFLNRSTKEKEEAQQQKFLENLKQLYINISFIKDLVKMPKYAKYLKSLLTNKSRLEEACTVTMNERCSAVLRNKLPTKEKDRSFTIPFQLGLGEPKLTRMSLELADRSIQYLSGIVKNVLIKVHKLVLPIDFVILDMPEDSRNLIILGRPFLATAHAMIDVFNKNKTLRVGDDEVIFDMVQSNIETKDKKGAENLAADHLSRLENPHMKVLTEREIADEFPDEHLMVLRSKFKDDDPYETLEILAHYHSGPTSGHHSANVTTKKVYESEFYWPSIFKDANEFGVPRALISDRGTHFCNSQLEKALQRYGVTHKLSTAYHPQSNGQTKVTNRAIKRILERSVGYNPKGWSEKLNDALWAFRTTYKTLIGCTPFRLVYRKACHLPVEIEHKAHWALKQFNMDLTLASESHLMQLNKLAELRDGAYENIRIYKERTKKWNDSRLRSDKDFKVSDKVLLYNSRLKMYPGKLKSKWSGPNIVKKVYPYGAVEIINMKGFNFKVNG